MKKNLDQLTALVRKRLEAEFDFLQIVDVQLRDGQDSDGDAILWVDVVFVGERKAIDAGALTGAVRKLRPTLLENDEEAFPVFSFIAANEVGALAREAR